MKTIAIESTYNWYWLADDQQIASIEKTVLAQVKKQAPYRRLQTLPGIGRILGMTIALESGNKYLAWAFVQAAHCAKRHHADCARFFERKKQQRNTSVATKALAAKLAKAA